MRTKEQQRFHYVAVINVLIGISYLLFRFFLKEVNDFGEAPYPQQAWLQYTHILLASIWMFFFGVLWKEHISLKLKLGKKAKRVNGLYLTFISFFMCLSGYLIQIPLTQDYSMGVIHCVFGVLWIILYLMHIL